MGRRSRGVPLPECRRHPEWRYENVQLLLEAGSPAPIPPPQQICRRSARGALYGAIVLGPHASRSRSPASGRGPGGPAVETPPAPPAHIARTLDAFFDRSSARQHPSPEGTGSPGFPALGFLPDEVAKLFDEAGGNIEVEEVDTEPVADRFWISIYGPLPSQAVASPAPAQPD
jgi:hypothetical protein